MNQTDDISSLLEFSRQQDELIEGHQKEMRQVLDNNRHLRSALAQSQAQVEQQSEEIRNLKAQVAQLTHEKNQLLARPNVVKAKQFVANQQVEKQIFAIPLLKSRTIRRQLLATNQKELPLWETE